MGKLLPFKTVGHKDGRNAGPAFRRYIGIDYSGAATPTTSRKGLWRRSFARDDRTADQHDAYSVCAWLQKADLDGRLARYLNPFLLPGERAVARIEGWSLGVM
ncbi:MAG: hypothetical protein WAM73_09870 [Desulfobacterales bacterium]